MSTINLAKEAFNAKQARSLTGITQKQVVYWDQQGVVRPSVKPATGKGSRRLYSYIDLLALKTVKQLRSEGMSLQRIRQCVSYLRRRQPDVSQPLPFFELVACGESVFIAEDEKTYVDALKRPGQTAVRHIVDVGMLSRELRQAVIELSAKRVEDVAVGDFAYQVAIEPDEGGGYVAEVGGLPGCITQGETLEETLENAADAITSYLEAAEELKRRGVELPIRRKRRRGKATA